MPGRSIAEDVVFVPLCGEHEGWPVCSDGLPRAPPGLDVGVAGAYLFELAIAGSIERRADLVIATRRKPPADAHLAAVLQQIVNEQPHSAYWWIQRLADNKPHLRHLECLRARRLVGEYDQVTRGWFGKRTSRRCFAPDWGCEGLVMEQLHAVLDGECSDERTVGLLAILCVGGWHHWFTHTNLEKKRRAEVAAENHWIGREVAHVLGAQSALNAAGMIG